MQFLFFLVLKLQLLHPFHVSVCDMVYKSDDKHLKISVRMFLDDLEDALGPQTKLEFFDITADSTRELTESLLADYFDENLKIEVKNKPIDIVYLGSEIEGDAMWSYLEVTKLRSFTDMRVHYTVLQEVFPDQENLVHVRVDGTVRSCRIYGDLRSEVLRWN